MTKSQLNIAAMLKKAGRKVTVIDETKPRTVNNGFWDKTPQERAASMDAACERNGVSNFFDLPPEERARAYED